MVAAENERPEGESEVGRRVLLRGMAAMGIAAVGLPLASCGSNDVPEAVTATPGATPGATVAATPKAGASATPKATAKATKSPSAEPTATGAATSKATPKPAAKKLVKVGGPLVATTDIPVNSGMLFEADEYIVTQPKAGTFLGFDSLCTHEGCPVDVFDTPGEMDCSCHSSKFKLDTGKPFAGPAKKPLPSKPIIVEGGQIYKAKEA